MTQPFSLTVNGDSRQTSAATIADFVRELGLDPKKVAVEHNGVIAPRSTLHEVALGDGDALEIVHFVGGG
ncbi:sulfur carrier protein ThiS [Aurantiacibacter marinus]|uniref:Bifunctional sulfur carrier protein/thiazole synthase n=1 Tax=Aurantiacibacter marinus TaxID=874156 RepID=A0A0H0XQT0_9SPHN|nr:sulfur carrier protein ThiS [Aurantiacibacter marinus]KLI64719.1 bifunctional sulfur carrier protein/thiazole synthase [Aurantiacibacter marinus]